MDTASEEDCRCIKVFVQPRPSSIGCGTYSQCQEVFPSLDLQQLVFGAQAWLGGNYLPPEELPGQVRVW